MRVLIAGCGYVGSRLAELALEDGHRVWALRRSAGRGCGGGVVLPIDLLRPETLEDLPEGLDAVIYSASADGSDVEAYGRAYVEGPANLLAALALQGASPRRLIFTSSTRVYGYADGRAVDDATPPQPADAQAERLLTGERAFLAAPWPASVVRFGGIYGPGRRYLVDLVARGGARCREEPASHTNRIHREDAARILLFLLDRDDADGTWLGVDPHPSPRCEVLDSIAARLGLGPVPRDGDSKRGGDKRCYPTRLLAAGFTYQYPSYREGYGEMLASGEPGSGKAESPA